MTPFEEFDALDRIIKVIKKYSQLPTNQVGSINNELIQSYLIKHLLALDLQLWLRLEDQDRLAESLGSAKREGALEAPLYQFEWAAHALRHSWFESHRVN